jgi:hypothetical protein
MKTGLILLLFLSVFAPSAPAQVPAEAPPHVMRVLALGHDPERRYRKIGGGVGSPGGLLVMEDPDPSELPPPQVYFRALVSGPAAPGAPRPGKVEFRAVCPVSLNSVQQVALPRDIPPDAKLAIEREVPPKPAPAGARLLAEKTYEQMGSLQLKPGSTSSLVILYNAVGSRTWENVRPSVVDTSETSLPAGAILVYNLCREAVQASVGGRVGVLASGQSAFVRPAVDADNLFSLRLLLSRSGEDIQLVDSVRELPKGARAFLIIYPVPLSRNAREADFILFVLPPDSKSETEPAVAPVPGPAGAKSSPSR